ncbi:hypothetical protein ABIC86_001571 [Paenibacillus sp. DS2363]
MNPSTYEKFTIDHHSRTEVYGSTKVYEHKIQSTGITAFTAFAQTFLSLKFDLTTP